MTPNEELSVTFGEKDHSFFHIDPDIYIYLYLVDIQKERVCLTLRLLFCP